MYAQILIYHISNLIIKYKFFEEFHDFLGTNLSEKCHLYMKMN